MTGLFAIWVSYKSPLGFVLSAISSRRPNPPIASSSMYPNKERNEALKANLKANLKAKSDRLFWSIKKLCDAEIQLAACNAVKIDNFHYSIDVTSLPERLQKSTGILTKQYTDLVNFALKTSVSNVRFSPPESQQELQGMRRYTDWMLRLQNGGQGGQGAQIAQIAQGDQVAQGAQSAQVAQAAQNAAGAQIAAGASNAVVPVATNQTDAKEDGDGGAFRGWIKGRGRVLTGVIDIAMAITAVVVLVKAAEYTTGKDIGEDF